MTTCPLCQTQAPIATDTPAGDDHSWLCTRCGQRWSPGRVVRRAAYDAYVKERP